MIVSKLIGGIGNQMFQYSAGRAVSIKRKELLKLDKSGFEVQPGAKRHYSLHIFNIDENFISKSEILLAKLLHQHTSIIYPRTDVLTEFPERSGDLYLEGYFQSYRYFEKVEDSIRKDFTFKNKLSKDALDWQTLATKYTAISVHVRRGDYATDPVENKKFGLLPISYYQKAFKRLDSVKNPAVFVFSDDITWVKSNLKFPTKTFFVSSFGGSQEEDLRLMASCKHNIIANSTFSWWGAWLNNSPKKIVIAPKLWRQDGYNTIELLLPPTWIKL